MTFLVLFREVAPLTKTERNFIFNADSNSARHKKAKNAILDSLYSFIDNYEGFESLLANDKEGFRDLFCYPPTGEKKALFNDIMRCFVYWLKKSNHDGDCPFYQPSTMNQKIRTLFASIKCEYVHLPWTLSDFKYKGGFVSVLKELYSERQKMYKVSNTLLFNFILI